MAADGHLQTLVPRRPGSAVEQAADTRRVHGLRMLAPGFLSPELRGPLGPWRGTDDFLRLPRARGRVSMPNPHGLSALILKGDLCGSELSVTVAARTDGASGTDQDDVAGQRACLGTKKYVVLLIGVS